MQKTWRVRDKIEFNKINFSGKYNPLVLQLLFNRRIKTENQIEDFLAFDYEKNVGDPFLFADMEKAVNRIVLAKKNKHFEKAKTKHQTKKDALRRLELRKKRDFLIKTGKITEEMLEQSFGKGKHKKR